MSSNLVAFASIHLISNSHCPLVSLTVPFSWSVGKPWSFTW